MTKKQVSHNRLTPIQTGETFGVAPLTVRRWITDGCPARKINGRWSLKQSDVAAWLKKRGRLAASGKARQGRPQPEGATSTIASTADAGYKIERAKLKRLEREEKEGLLHNVEECRIRRLQQIRAVRTAFQSLPRSVAIEIAGKTAKTMERILRKRIKEIIDQRFVGDTK